MHHLLMNTTSPWIITPGAHRKIIVPELAPHADHFDSFGRIRFHEKVISHRAYLLVILLSTAKIPSQRMVP